MTTAERSEPDILPYSCVFIDANIHCFLRAAYESICHHDLDAREKYICHLKSLFTTNQNPNFVLPALSVRSAFDLWLNAMNFAKESEILMTAITIPDMPDIIRAHHLVPVPCDININTLTSSSHLLQLLVTKRTVAIVVAHLFGKQLDLTDIELFAKRNHLLLVEDCAEIFAGFEYLGQPSSDLSLFSFGVIKTNTCFGGAIAKVRHLRVYERMMEIERNWPIQTYGQYLAKVIKYGAISPCLNWPTLMKSGMKLMRSLHVDHKSLFVRMLRAFPSQLLTLIRRRPSSALLSMMCYRLSAFNSSQCAKSKINGDFAVTLLTSTNSVILGTRVKRNNYWLFPIVVNDAENVVKRLNWLGIDAYNRATQLTVIDDRDNKGVTTLSKALMGRLIYLPIHKNVPMNVIDKICTSVRAVIDNNSLSKCDSFKCKL